METTKERILLFIKRIGISQKKFEETAGLSNGYVNNVKASPSAKILQKIFCAYPDLNKTWLLTGEGSMLTADAAVEASTDAGDVSQQSSGDHSPNVNGSGNVVGGAVEAERLMDALSKAMETIQEQNKVIARLLEERR